MKEDKEQQLYGADDNSGPYQRKRFKILQKIIISNKRETKEAKVGRLEEATSNGNIL